MEEMMSKGEKRFNQSFGDYDVYTRRFGDFDQRREGI